MMQAKNEEQNKRKGVSTADFFCIGFGAIVGVGWAVSINSWMINCGGPVPAAAGYLLCLVMMIPLGLCYCEMVPMIPVAGGGMAFAYKAFDHDLAFASGWASYGAFVAIIPWEAIQITDVLGYLIPGLKNGKPLYSVMGSDIYPATILIGLACSLLIYFLNMGGLSSAAKAQRILCFVLVGAAVLGAVFAVIGGRAENLTPLYDVSDPAIYGEGLKQVSHRSFFGGAFAIVAQAAFFLAGFETIPQGVEEAGGSIKSVGKTVVLSVTLACLFYAGLLLCFGSALPWKEFAGMERPAAASMFRALYPGTLGQALFWLITIGAIAGLFTTWNGFFTPSANLLMSMGRGRLVPQFFARQNERGVAVNGQLIALLLSCAGPFLGANLIDTITCFSAAAFVLSWCITAFSLVRLRKKHPEMPRPFRIPGGIATGIFASVVSLAVFIFMFVPASPFFIGKLAVIMFLVWMAVGFALYLLNRGERRKMTAEEIEKSVFRN